MELGSCHPSDAQNFDFAPRFLENVCTALTLLRINEIASCYKYNRVSYVYWTVHHCDS